jgi:hypothetical protein
MMTGEKEVLSALKIGKSQMVLSPDLLTVKEKVLWDGMRSVGKVFRLFNIGLVVFLKRRDRRYSHF